MSIQKKEYELSVWTEHLDENGNKVEEKGAIIGAHDMEYLGRATDIKLTRKINGTNTLSFQMPSKFFDSKIGAFTHNELSDVVKNESKLKLHYLDQWFEFYVKNITENKQFKAIMYQYSCEDSFIDELSRTGYEIQFDNELNNSVEEVGTFTEEILETSIWDYTPEYNIGDFTEYNEQRFYKIPLSQFGGSIHGYKIKLKVNNEALFYEDGTPKSYLEKKLIEDNINWTELSFEEKEKYLKNILSVKNVFTNKKRTLEYGDDLSRAQELFWDPYYKDNGEELLDENNMVKLSGKYIYVPITDLSPIMGSIYEEAQKAVEEPAIYGQYGKMNREIYALQPSSKNPRALVQFIFLEDSNEYIIDDAKVLANNEYHYVIPIEEWNAILAKQLSNKSGVVYWYAPISDNPVVSLTAKYKTEKDSENIYTVNAMPYSSTIDDFTWYPVYSDGYLEMINDNEVNQARKISVTDRTEYNKESDIFVTVYNNKADEFSGLYSEEELENKNLRVVSKTQTRLITPTLARNLVENGSKITDTNGWEPRIQNRNHEKLAGTGSSVDLLEVNVQSTVQRAIDSQNITINEYDVDGTIDDEIISDYYLEIKSPGFNNTQDFSLEGTTQVDYLLNFGLISQEKKIEKDKVYALRMKTGSMKETGVTISYRVDGIDAETYNYDEEESYRQIPQEYSDTFDNYKKLYDMLSDFNTNKDYLYLEYPDEMELFEKLIDRWPEESDPTKSDKLKLVDGILETILFGGNVAIWASENIEADGKSSISLEPAQDYFGIISIHDGNIQQKYLRFDSIAIKPETINESKKYTNSDVRFIKYCLYNNLNGGAIKTNAFLSADGVQLTNSDIRNWKETYINYSKIFEQKLNQDLDRIVIGKGAINLEGNYTLQGAEEKNGISENDTEYISFKDLFQAEEIMILPRKDLSDLSIKEKLGIDTNIYHIKANNWAWNTNKMDISITDEPYLLFKATQTIENPYIGIRLESGKLSIIFDSIQKTIYSENLNKGVQIDVVKEDSEDTYYYDNIPIKIVPISSSTCTDAFLDAIEYDKTTGIFNADKIKSVTWSNEYLKNSFNSWMGKTSAENPAYDQTFLVSNDKRYTIPYLVILNDNPIGVTYMYNSSAPEPSHGAGKADDPEVDPEVATYSTTYWTGDARIIGMGEVTTIQTTVAYSGKTATDLRDTYFSDLDALDDCNIISWWGVNGIENAENRTALIQVYKDLADSKPNTRDIWVLTIGLCYNDSGSDKVDGGSGQDLSEFNNYIRIQNGDIQNELTGYQNIHIIDVEEYIQTLGGIRTVDNLHYSEEVYKSVQAYVINQINGGES